MQKRSATAAGSAGTSSVFVAEVSETLELEKLGLITPYDEVFGSREKLDAFLSSLMPEFLGNSECSNGKFCGAPLVRSMPVAFYNLDQLRAIGVTGNTLPANWTELEQLLVKLQPRSAHPPFCLGGEWYDYLFNWTELEQLLVKLQPRSAHPPFCLGGEWYDYLFEAAVRQSGGALMDNRGRITLATPEAVEALKFWKRLMDQKLMQRLHSWKATINGFAGGFCSVTFYSSAGLEAVTSTAHFPWMADMLPKNKTFGGAVGGGNLYFSSGMNAEEKSASLKFARFLYRPEIQARISLSTGFFPVVASAFATPDMAKRYEKEEAFSRVRRQLQYAKPKLMSTNNLAVRNILKTAIDRSLDDGEAPEVSLSKAQREVDKLSNRSN
jgi:ABC-type glycerol-3-phosphate transport system substrate-binding protein